MLWIYCQLVTVKEILSDTFNMLWVYCQLVNVKEILSHVISNWYKPYIQLANDNKTEHKWSRYFGSNIARKTGEQIAPCPIRSVVFLPRYVTRVAACLKKLLILGTWTWPLDPCIAFYFKEQFQIGSVTFIFLSHSWLSTFIPLMKCFLIYSNIFIIQAHSKYI